MDHIRRFTERTRLDHHGDLVVYHDRRNQVGVQCFKLSSISLNPFGKEIEYEGGAFSFVINVLWFLFAGLSLRPFGAHVERTHYV